MTVKKWGLLVLTLISFGLLIFWPHFSYPYPFHVDEWHHLAEARRLANPLGYFNWLQAEPGRATSGLEIGFQLILLGLSQLVNSIIIYKFLPALWAIISGLTLFFVSYQKSQRNFLVAWFSLIFFMSIRTNTNLTGLWFFTPLSFAFPFIFLYTYFLSEGFLLNKKKYLLWGSIIAIALLTVHPLSVLFSLPIFAIWGLLNYKSFRDNYWLGLVALIITISGWIFFTLIFGLEPLESLKQIFLMIQFPKGWGVLELNNPLTELYPWPAWLWAVVGIGFILKQNPRVYSFYLTWPIVLLGSTLLYRWMGISYFSPFQRNLYYLTLILPLFSGYGLFYFTQKILPSIFAHWPNKKLATTTIGISLILVTFFTIFVGYYQLPIRSRLYRAITHDDYRTIKFLATKPSTVIITTPFLGTALIALSDHEPTGAINFYGNRQAVKDFYSSQSGCLQRKKIIKSTQATIIYWPKTLGALNCLWVETIYETPSHSLFKVK